MYCLCCSTNLVEPDNTNLRGRIKHLNESESSLVPSFGVGGRPKVSGPAGKRTCGCVEVPRRSCDYILTFDDNVVDVEGVKVSDCAVPLRTCARPRAPRARWIARHVDCTRGDTSRKNNVSFFCLSIPWYSTVLFCPARRDALLALSPRQGQEGIAGV